MRFELEIWIKVIKFRLSEPKIRRHVAGRSSLEYSTDSSKQRIVRDNNAPVTESIIQSCR